MTKVSKIEFIESFKLLCQFQDGEHRILDLRKALRGPMAQRILTTDVFPLAKVGKLGQIYWEDMGEIRGLDGQIEVCEYDISPEFVYHNSIPVAKKI
ncbi:MAG: DUF2442 domain-containing protein [Cytophagales bacterium]|nr:DUF2442 domain-containing protein [Cytophagales bacterium]